MVLSLNGEEWIQNLDPRESRVSLDSSGSKRHSQQPLIRVIWSLVYCGSLSTNVNTGSGDAPIAVVRTHNVNPGANSDGACRYSLTSLSETGTRCRVDRD